MSANGNINTKLYKIERVEDFALAIAGGADVNEKVQGKPLVLWLWNKLISCSDPESEAAQTLVKKLEILESAGVDMSPCVWSDMVTLLYTTQVNFVRIERLLRSASARRAIYGSDYYMGMLRDLQKTLRHMEELIDEEFDGRNGNAR